MSDKLEVGSVGGISVLIDGPSRDFIIAMRTEVGTVIRSLSGEDALRLGILLIRETGQRRVFTVSEEPVIVGPRPEDTEEKHANDTDSGGPAPDASEPSSGPGRGPGGEGSNGEGPVQRYTDRGGCEPWRDGDSDTSSPADPSGG